ncbi:TetR/AcrR family transcriptional regulator [Pararhizobium sp.]|uniref:TetR/AcrR family transcriptional regulator n=1 Tax=Pararhizobium sp. TaxID=1977563 RepID=UPI0027228191|nr:TetR family transcriptional regulator [Pararhizobium sp.]MDO9415743.1 TetR family transcriptional regulator [Pararhizobium sp.]
MLEKQKKQTKAERTREAILSAARILFAERGYDGATVRDIAARAGIDPAMVIRYFGGKDMLFVQAADLDLRLPDLSDVPGDAIGETLVRHFLAIWETGGAAGGLPVALRSAASNELAAGRLREIFATQVAPALARAPGIRPGPLAGLVASQLLGLAFCRYVLKLPPVVVIPPETLVIEVGRSVQSLFDAAR